MILRWMRERRNLRNFSKAWKEAAEQKFDSLEIDQATYLKCVKAAENPKVMKEAMNQLVQDPELLGGLRDWDWQAIYDWFINYFVPAMKVILPLVITLLGEDDE